MVRIQISFTGLEETLANINQLPGKLGKFVIADGLKGGADVLRDATKQTTLFKDQTKDLRRSIRSRKSRSKVTAQVFAGGKRGYYAFWVEYGTIKMEPRPYLESALLENEDVIYHAAVLAMRASFANLGNRLISGQGITREIRRLARA